MAAMSSSLGLRAAKSKFTGSFDASEAASARFNPNSRVGFARASVNHEQSQSRRAAMVGLVAVAAGVLAVEESRALTGIKINGPPPPSGGLPGTENADQPRDLDLPLKERFFIQPLSPAEAVGRIKDASKDIVGVKELIDKKSWPYVRNDLRNKATYLRYDLKTIMDAKPKAERKALKKLTDNLFEVIDKLDFAARAKNPTDAGKCYAEAVAALDTVIAKISA
ncbi:oxygen-evolving enhancer protein 3-2, chloroplastic [Selaginella moellendorffii]|nr:oxygen-evolving enhancer protein 3-2, chloroplastic [Selaginella moellendorffii]|eukprot:XP_002992117.2 oxygen-evolving enhancer protein 3-2, chloroplastic [Selaginella moellendorffii]